MHCPRRTPSDGEPTCYTGHPRSHLILYSFGVLKFSTALGGGMAKIADRTLYAKMRQLSQADPVQDTQQYARNVKKYFYLYWLLNVPYVIKPLMYLVRLFRLNHMEFVVNRLRAFTTVPKPEELFLSLRRQPCRPLLAFLLHRFRTYDYEHLRTQKQAGLYVIERLSQTPGLRFVGTRCPMQNFWLFPMLVAKPDLFVRLLSQQHVDAYRDSTQLNVITKQLTDTDNLPVSIDENHKCPNAEHLIEHVIYLPVHCYVPRNVLDQLVTVVQRTAKQVDQYHLRSKL